MDAHKVCFVVERYPPGVRESAVFEMQRGWLVGDVFWVSGKAWSGDCDEAGHDGLVACLFFLGTAFAPLLPA